MRERDGVPLCTLVPSETAVNTDKISQDHLLPSPIGGTCFKTHIFSQDFELSPMFDI